MAHCAATSPSARIVDVDKPVRSPDIPHEASYYEAPNARDVDDASRRRTQAPLLANGAEAWCDPLAITPILEHAAPELLAVVRKVFESSSRGVRHEAVLMVKTA